MTASCCPNSSARISSTCSPICGRPAMPSTRPGSRRSANSASPSTARWSSTASASSFARRSSPGTCSARRERPAARCAMSIPRSSGCRSSSQGMTQGRHVVTCNGRRLPLAGTGVAGEAVAGAALQGLAAGLGPASDHPPHAPLTFDVDRPLDRPGARRLRLSCRPSGRPQLRGLPREFARGRGAPARALPASRP